MKRFDTLPYLVSMMHDSSRHQLLSQKTTHQLPIPKFQKHSASNH